MHITLNYLQRRRNFSRLPVTPSPQCKHVALVQIRANQLERIMLAGDVAVGNQHDAARDALLSRQTQRLLQRGKQFGAAGAALLRQ